MNLTKIQRAVIASATLSLALVLRVYHLATESYWTDEIFTLQVSSQPLLGVIRTVDVHPPVYVLLVHFWIGIFGSTEPALRSFSVLFGLLGVIAIYRLGKLLFDRNTGLIAALLVAVSSFHLTYSQEGRSYAFLFWLGCVTFYYFTRFVEGSKLKHGIFLFLTSLVLLYTHNFGAFLIATLNVLYVVTRIFWPGRVKASWGSWILVQVLTGIGYIPWILATMSYSKVVGHDFWIETPSLKVVPDTLRVYAGGGKALVLALFTLATSLITFRKMPDRQRGHFLWMPVWILVSLAIPFIISLLWTPVFYPRYTIISSAPFFLMIAGAVVRWKWPRLQAAAVLLMCVLSLNSVRWYYTDQVKEDWRGATQFLDTNAQDKDLVLFHLSGQHIYSYYSKRTPKLATVRFPARTADIMVPEHEKKVTEENVVLLDGLVSGHGRVWLSYNHSRDADRKIMAELKRLGYREVSEKVFSPAGIKPDAAAESRVIELHLFEK